MSGGWQGSTRKQRLPADWTARRMAVLARCNRRCEQIKSTGWRCTNVATDVDHIVAGDNHELDNLQGLCRWHHNAKTTREALAARQKPPAKRKAEDHPGKR